MRPKRHFTQSVYPFFIWVLWVRRRRRRKCRHTKSNCNINKIQKQKWLLLLLQNPRQGRKVNESWSLCFGLTHKLYVLVQINDSTNASAFSLSIYIYLCVCVSVFFSFLQHAGVKLLKIPIIIRFKIRIMKYGHFSFDFFFGCLVNKVPYGEKQREGKNYRLSVLVRPENRLNITLSESRCANRLHFHLLQATPTQMNEWNSEHLGVKIPRWFQREKKIMEREEKCNPVKMQLENTNRTLKVSCRDVYRSDFVLVSCESAPVHTIFSGILSQWYTHRLQRADIRQCICCWY